MIKTSSPRKISIFLLWKNVIEVEKVIQGKNKNFFFLLHRHFKVIKVFFLREIAWFLDTSDKGSKVDIVNRLKKALNLDQTPFSRSLQRCGVVQVCFWNNIDFCFLFVIGFIT